MLNRNNTCRHSRARGNPLLTILRKKWIPACAGMTACLLLTACGQSGPLFLPKDYGKQSVTTHADDPSASQTTDQP